MTIGFLFQIAWDVIKSLLLNRYTFIIFGVFIVLRMIHRKTAYKKGRFKI